MSDHLCACGHPCTHHGADTECYAQVTTDGGECACIGFTDRTRDLARHHPRRMDRAVALGVLSGVALACATPWAVKGVTWLLTSLSS